jgi:hypothetical protein
VVAPVGQLRYLTASRYCNSDELVEQARDGAAEGLHCALQGVREIGWHLGLVRAAA